MNTNGLLDYTKGYLDKIMYPSVRLGKQKADKLKKTARALYATIEHKKFPLHIRIEKARKDPLGVIDFTSTTAYGVCDPSLSVILPNFPVVIAIRNSNDTIWMLNVLVHEMGHYEQFCNGSYEIREDSEGFDERPFELEATRLGCQQLVKSNLPAKEKEEIIIIGNYHLDVWASAYNQI